MDSLSEQHEEWLVLYVTPYSESESANKACKKILDKLRSDLNPQGSRSKERVLRVFADPTGKFASSPLFQEQWNVRSPTLPRNRRRERKRHRWGHKVWYSVLHVSRRFFYA